MRKLKAFMGFHIGAHYVIIIKIVRNALSITKKNQ